MANFVLSYDLNGPNPSHKQVDAVLDGLGAERGRILETVWYVGWTGSCEDLFDAVNGIMSANDQLFVAEISDIVWRNLKLTDEGLQEAYARWRRD